MDVEEGQLHPLQNPAILSNFFNICPSSLLRQCRLVCKNWFTLSQAACRSSIPITLDSEDGYKSHARIGGNHDLQITPIHTFLDFVEDPINQVSRKPFSSFHLRGWYFQPDDSLEARFWNLVGTHVIKLKLTDCTFEDADHFRSIIYYTCPNLRQLKFRTPMYYKPPPSYPDTPFDPFEYNPKDPKFKEQMNLKTISFDWEFPQTNLYVSWLDLLSHFPSLTSIKLRNSHHLSREYAIKELLEAVKTIRQHDSKKMLLKKIDLDPFISVMNDQGSPEVFSLLRLLNMTLTELSIYFTDDTSAEFIEDVIKFHGEFLVRLEATGTSRKNRMTGFPYGMRLENLQEIYIKGITCENMEFLKFTPNLKKLVVTDDWGEKQYDQETKSVSNTSAEEMDKVTLARLTDFRLEYSVRDSDLTKLVKWMPNVESLGMILNDTQFALVCQSWRGVSYLEDMGRSLTDRGLIGEAAQANIALLQNLTQFTLASKHITEASLLQGLIRLPLLEDLTVHEDIDISDDGHKAINARNVRLMTHDPENPPSPMEPDWY